MIPGLIFSQAIHHIGTEVLQNHIRLLYQLTEDLLAFLFLQIQGDAALVAVDGGVECAGAVGREGGIPAGFVSAARDLDLDHICAHLAQPGSGKGAAEYPGHIQNGNIAKCALFHKMLLSSIFLQ